MSQSSLPSSPHYDAQPLWEDILPAGFHWSARLRRGTVLRLTTREAGANLSALLFNAEEKLERLNIPDSLKAQHTAYLTTGHACYSDMGRILAAIIHDTVGWHDVWCGLSDAAQIAERYGSKTYADARNAMYRNGRDSLLIELGKWGLGKRDLVTPINFFSKVSVDAEGQLQWHADHAPAGSVVELRLEMDCLLLLSSAPHPLDHRPSYSPAAITLTAFAAHPLTVDDPCLTACAENTRGYQNNARYFNLSSMVGV
ncbi:MAG: urea amidolyase associated protein UAAP1 [Pseudomonadota bacterium]|nr:urea amidolyase associated protein UAAP1 [Pseudomonadota bacterium]